MTTLTLYLKTVLLKDILFRSDESNCPDLDDGWSYDIFRDCERWLQRPVHYFVVYCIFTFLSFFFKKRGCWLNQLQPIPPPPPLLSFQTKYNFGLILSDGKRGFLCGTEICIKYNRWCQIFDTETQYSKSYNEYLKTCPGLVRTFNSERLCQNATFWKYRDRSNRCKGNNPGQINPGKGRAVGRQFRALFSVDSCLGHFGSTCRDNSDVVCEPKSKACTSNLTKFCDSKETCIHHTLECDGYIHCSDGSDEEETKCQACPRDFGYPADKLKVG